MKNCTMNRLLSSILVLAMIFTLMCGMMVSAAEPEQPINMISYEKNGDMITVTDVLNMDSIKLDVSYDSELLIISKLTDAKTGALLADSNGEIGGMLRVRPGTPVVFQYTFPEALFKGMELKPLYTIYLNKGLIADSSKANVATIVIGEPAPIDPISTPEEPTPDEPTPVPTPTPTQEPTPTPTQDTRPKINRMYLDFDQSAITIRDEVNMSMINWSQIGMNNEYLIVSYLTDAETGDIIMAGGKEVSDSLRFFPGDPIKLTYKFDGASYLGKEVKPVYSVYLNKGLLFTSEYANVDTAIVRYFTDVQSGDWFYPYVSFAAARNLFKGTDDTTFSPNAKMSRAMLVTVLWRLAGEPESSIEIPFKDVKEDAYYAEAVKWGYENEIIKGVSKDSFAPDAQITREQMVTFFSRYANPVAATSSQDPKVSREELAKTFKDASAISEYAISPMYWAVESGLITGTAKDTLAPQGVATRAQVATILTRFVQNMESLSLSQETLIQK